MTHIMNTMCLLLKNHGSNEFVESVWSWLQLVVAQLFCFAMVFDYFDYRVV